MPDADVIPFFCNKEMSKIKKTEKLMKIVNIDGENLLIFWTTWGLLMELSGKMFHSKPGLHTFEVRDSPSP